MKLAPSRDLIPASICEDLRRFANRIETCIIEEGFNGSCFGILGGYGTGKTMTMRHIESSFKNNHYLNVTTIWFDAWRFEHLGSVSVALASAMEAKLHGGGVASGIGKFLSSIKFEFAGASLEAGLRNPGDAQRGASRLWDNQENFEPGKTEGTREVFAVFIDDLDRCSADKAFQMLDHLKCLFELPNFVYVVGLNPKVLDKKNSGRYGKAAHFSVQEYLDKIMHSAFFLPEPSPQEMNRAFSRVFASDAREHLELRIQSMVAVCPRSYRAILKAQRAFHFIYPELREGEHAASLACIIMKLFYSTHYADFRNDIDTFLTHVPTMTGPIRGDLMDVAAADFSAYVDEWLGKEYAEIGRQPLERIFNLLGASIN